MAKRKKSEIVFTPELILELNLSSSKKKSIITIKTLDDSIEILEGIKDVVDDHIVLIYLDINNVVVGIDAFLRDMKDLNKEQPNRALSRTILNYSSSKAVRKVIIVQTFPDIESPTSKTINLNDLANFTLKIVLFEIEVIDCILMGKNNYFSFKRNKKAWNLLKEKMKLRKKLWGLK